jgi:UDP-2-acetamido-2,6-beta-L-arabino-hexul-4-ose reductase
MIVGLTGAGGQLGYHVRCRLQYHHGHEIRAAGRGTFADAAALAGFVKGCDAIVHLAGVNRGSDDEVTEGNRFVARSLGDAMDQASSKAHLIYASSSQRSSDNVYGRAKAEAADFLAAHCARTGAPFVEVILPNLFGEFTRPRYNSFVATFCDQIAEGQAPSIHADNPVSLMHYIEAADLFADALSGGTVGVLSPQGRRTSVGSVADKLLEFSAGYKKGGIVPDLRDEFDLRLFNTFRASLYPALYPFRLDPRSDNRGALVECVKNRHGGQVFYSSTHPGITRGNHFHFDKVERFVVLSGQGRISIRRVFSDDVVHFDVTGDEPCFIDMPTYHAHNITNTGGGELLTLFWAHDLFDPTRPDTYMETV